MKVKVMGWIDGRCGGGVWGARCQVVVVIVAMAGEEDGRSR